MLTRLEQICIQEEATENTAVADGTLYATGNASYSLIDPSCEFDLQTFDRNIKRDTLTPLRGLTGMKMGRVRFSLEMAGNTSSTGYPEFDLPLRACGFRREKLVKLTVGTITNGPFKHGETITQDTSGAFGVVVGDTYDGQTTLWVAQENLLGCTGASAITAFDTTNTISAAAAPDGSGALCGAPSAVSGTVSGQSITVPAGVAWWPYSFSLQRIQVAATGITVAVSDGEVLHQESSNSWWIVYGDYAATSGAQGVYLRRLTGHGFINTGTSTEREFKNSAGTVVFRSHGSLTTESQFQIPSLSIGCLFDGVREAISGARGSVRMRTAIGEPAIMEFEFRGQQKSFTDGGLLSGVSYTQQLPPVVLDADFSVGTDALTFAQEAVPNVAGVEFDMAQQVEFRKSIDAAGGLLESHIIGKRPTFTMDPEVMPEGFFSWMANFTGNTNMRTRMRVGTSNQNKFLLTAPGLAITSSGAGDRDGFKTRQIQGMLTSGAQTASTLNRDNELVIIYQIS